MIERTTVRLPSALMDIIRRKAAARGTTVTAIIEESLLLTANQPDNAPAKITYPRTFKGGQGEMPGIDLTRMADIYEMEDLEYAERLHKGFK